MATITFDPATFRALYPQFSNATAFPDVRLQSRFDMGTGYVSSDTYGCMDEVVRAQALDLMTAHLLAIDGIIAQNNYQGQVGIVTAATVDGISITLNPPPVGTSQWRWWLNTTPYGAQLIGLLEAQSVGGFYVGGLPERSAFRKVGGYF